MFSYLDWISLVDRLEGFLFVLYLSIFTKKFVREQTWKYLQLGSKDLSLKVGFIIKIVWATLNVEIKFPEK